MKCLFRLLALLLLAATPGLPAAPAALDGLITAGTSIRRDAASPFMGYLVWSAPGPVLPSGLTLAVWMQPNGTGPFVRQGLVQPVQDEPSVKLLLNRASLLGSDLTALVPSVDELLSVWQPRATAIRVSKTLPPELAGLPLSEKIARLLKRGSELAEAGLALRQMSTAQPVLRMALGQAWAGPIPAGAPSVFEIRRYDAATATDGAVMGRLTLTPGSGTALATPLPALQVADLTPTGDLTIKLRWGIPDALRRQQQHLTGFRLHRVRRGEADSAGLAANATLAQLQSFRASFPAAYLQPSASPILASKLFTALTAADFSNQASGDPSTYFFADRGDPTATTDNNFTDGTQFYYYLTALDLLGRESAPAPRVLGTAVRTIPPDVPTDLTVTDEVVTSGPSLGQRRLVLRWTANNNAAPGLNGRTAQRYAIYRGATTDAATNPLALDSLADPAKLALLTPTFITHAPVSGRMTWADTGLLPTAPDGAKTRWYAVRAVHDTVLGAVLSDPCPPAFCAFRDRAGLPAPTGRVDIDCPLYGTRYKGLTILPRTPGPGEATGATTFQHIRLRCIRRDRSVEAVSFSLSSVNGPVNIGPIKFGPGTSEVAFDTFVAFSRSNVSCQTSDAVPCLSTISTITNLDFRSENNQRTEIRFESGKWSARELNPDNADDAQFLTPVTLSGFSYAGVNLVNATLGTNITGRSLLIQRRTSNPSVTPWRTTTVLEPTGTAITFVSPWSPVSGQSWRAYALPVPSPACPCVHAARPPGADLISPIDVLASFPPGTKEWRIYKQVDTGPLSLYLHGTSEVPTADTLQVSTSDTVLPPQGAVISYFLQCFESNGNPSPLVLLRTITLLPDPGEPILETPTATVDGQMAVRWFCPLPGVKTFRVWLAAREPNLPVPAAPGLAPIPPAAPYSVSFRRPGAETDENAWAIAAYELPTVPKNATNTVFTQTFSVLPNQEYIVWVEAIGLKASTKNDSSQRLFTWKAPTDGTVAWPARPLPAAGSYAGNAVYFPTLSPPLPSGLSTGPGTPRSSMNDVAMEEFPVGIRIGTLIFERGTANGSKNFIMEPGSYGNSPEAFLIPILTASGYQPVLPAALYRQTILPDGSPGNLIQTTPLREGIHWRDTTFDMDFNDTTPETAATAIEDPYLRVIVRENGALDIGELYLVDSQPVELGATYRYFLVRYRGTAEAAPGEIDSVLDCGQITIPEDL